MSFSFLYHAGQSPVDFLFDFVEASQGPFSGFDALDTRPKDGKATLKICMLMSLLIKKL